VFRFQHRILNDLMKQHGWIATGVPGKAIYTVGLMTLFNHPEVAIHAMAGGQAKSIIDVAVQLLRRGQQLEPGISNDIAEGYPALILDVHPSNFPDWFGQALGYYGAGLQIRQIVWCDSHGKFPGDPDYEHRFAMQKLFDVRRPEYDDPVGGWDCPCQLCAEDRATRARLN
jgi:hypothetical protein